MNFFLHVASWKQNLLCHLRRQKLRWVYSVCVCAEWMLFSRRCFYEWNVRNDLFSLLNTKIAMAFKCQWLDYVNDFDDRYSVFLWQLHYISSTTNANVRNVTETKPNILIVIVRIQKIEINQIVCHSIAFS